MVGAVDDALEGYGCLSVCDAWHVPDLLHGGESLRRLVGSQLDHKIESSRYGRAGFDVGNVLYLGNSVSARSPLQLAIYSLSDRFSSFFSTVESFDG